jgi:16S rRNA (cytidine1402-2'-O)-methyltransferase
VVGRELTKKFEQIVTITASHLPQWLEKAESLKGEFIILVAGKPSSSDQTPEHESVLMWANSLAPYLGSKEIAAILSQTLGLSKKEAYQITLKTKGDSNAGQ